jgi:hypothetical protein
MSIFEDFGAAFLMLLGVVLLIQYSNIDINLLIFLALRDLSYNNIRDLPSFNGCHALEEM